MVDAYDFLSDDLCEGAVKHPLSMRRIVFMTTSARRVMVSKFDTVTPTPDGYLTHGRYDISQ